MAAVGSDLINIQILEIGGIVEYAFQKALGRSIAFICAVIELFVYLVAVYLFGG